jgi:AbrB family looped-hinge helix DNA binding protein
VESAITAKGQATIPKAIREHLGLKPGDRVKFFMHPDALAEAARLHLAWHCQAPAETGGNGANERGCRGGAAADALPRRR